MSRSKISLVGAMVGILKESENPFSCSRLRKLQMRRLVAADVVFLGRLNSEQNHIHVKVHHFHAYQKSLSVKCDQIRFPTTVRLQATRSCQSSITYEIVINISLARSKQIGDLICVRTLSESAFYAAIEALRSIKNRHCVVGIINRGGNY